ncbi:nucleotidyl transferase AbiEii/AbiGii toxin family protein [Candidatus Gottesmanbacteria bacterium]|nr:nucleotidyl transferase AbiEii/AbiGii toxin family protein [Candidatus Gottesmanbacteria bacterium]
MFGSVLPDNAQAALALLGQNKPFPADTYLAGGSALALQLGHRRSVDFDFFTPTPFNAKKLSKSLSALGVFQEEVALGISLIGIFQGVKISCFQYEYPLIHRAIAYQNIAIAHPHDIAPMKLVAITDRGVKKDFVDLYAIIHQGVSLDEMFIFYEQKYHLLESNKYTILKALGYFEEADQTDMPEMLIPLTWEEVKGFLSKESMQLAKKLLEGTTSAAWAAH